jgi:hypothetical protein
VGSQKPQLAELVIVKRRLVGPTIQTENLEGIWATVGGDSNHLKNVILHQEFIEEGALAHLRIAVSGQISSPRTSPLGGRCFGNRIVHSSNAQ